MAARMVFFAVSGEGRLGKHCKVMGLKIQKGGKRKKKRRRHELTGLSVSVTLSHLRASPGFIFTLLLSFSDPSTVRLRLFPVVPPLLVL